MHGGPPPRPRPQRCGSKAAAAGLQEGRKKPEQREPVSARGPTGHVCRTAGGAESSWRVLMLHFNCLISMQHKIKTFYIILTRFFFKGSVCPAFKPPTARWQCCNISFVI